MMKIYKDINNLDLKEVLQRPVTDLSRIRSTVAEILEQVKNRGDEALKEYSERFDGVLQAD
ncbi:MAG TPA: histidinol dehydrogenase, partial [Chitinophagaceae bacterium]